jgi:phenylacetate-CoA ligase
MSQVQVKTLKNIVLPLADIAMKTSISSCFLQIGQMQRLSTEEIKSWQNQRLQDLVNHAYKRTKYYKTLFDNLQISPQSIQTSEDLKQLPVLTKQDILKHYNDLIPNNLNNIPHKQSATGGSTGDPMLYLLDHKSWSFTIANTIFNRERTGYQYGNKYIALGSTSLFVNKKPTLKHKVYYLLKKKIGVSGVNMSPKVCKSYIDLIRRKKIRFVYGYASAIYLLAKWMLENQENVAVDVCFTTSEVLTNNFRKTIKSAFNCKVLDCYGARDGGITAFAHQEGFFEVGYNCLVRIDEAKKSTQGPALLTDLLNYAMPLINYKLGDELVIDNKKNLNYPYNGQVINQVVGRSSDLIELGNGNTLTGPGFTVLFKDLPVDYYCIEKVTANTIKCYIKMLTNFNASHEDLIYSTFKKQMGSNTHFSIEYTDKIKYAKSGKRLYFVDNTM